MTTIPSNKVVNYIQALAVDGELTLTDIKALVGYINNLGDPENPARDIVRVRRGTEAELTNTSLDNFELGYTTDTQKLFIGTDDGPVLLTQTGGGVPSTGAILPIIMPEDVVNPQIGQMIITSDTKRIMFYVGDGVWKMPGAIGY